MPIKGCLVADASNHSPTPPNPLPPHLPRVLVRQLLAYHRCLSLPAHVVVAPRGSVPQPHEQVIQVVALAQCSS